MSDYRVLQLTNTNVGAVAADTPLPLGVITRKLCCGTAQGTNTFAVGTTGANYVQLNRTGYYKVTYNISAVAGAAGAVTVELTQNGTVVYTATQSAAAAGDTVNITIPFIVRVFPNCASVGANVPANLQVNNTGVALTGGISNFIVEKVY